MALKKEARNRIRKYKQKLNQISKQNAKNIVLQLWKTITHFFPDLFERIKEIEDCRNKSEYELVELIVACIFMMMIKSGSRNAFNNYKNTEAFEDNYYKLFKMRIPHMDTVNNVMCKLAEEELELLKAHMIRTLVIKKVLHKFRLFNEYFMIAIDGTGIISSSERHCEHCLTKTSKSGKTTYFHNVLEAKLICSNGFAISLMTEWIENPEGNFDKQDAELKAFLRLAPKLHKMHPRLPICITADGLYPNQTFFSVCKKYNWRYIVTFKDGNLPSVQDEVRILKEITSDNSCDQTKVIKKNRICSEYTWINGIEYKGFLVNWIECIETTKQIETKEEEIHCFVHLTDMDIGGDKAAQISQAGRLRWKIENEGFNTQKNQGYNLKHKFSRVNLTAAKNYYQCIQIAHLINQLMIFSKEFQGLLKGKVTIKHLWFILIGYLIFAQIDESAIEQLSSRRIQVRFV